MGRLLSKSALPSAKGTSERVLGHTRAGVLLYELLDGRPPFQSTRHFELVHRIVTVDIRMPSVSCSSEVRDMLLLGAASYSFLLNVSFSFAQHVRSDAADLIRKLLKYDPSERLPLVGRAGTTNIFRRYSLCPFRFLVL